jgi:SAM-dependent methyltransferase
MSTWSSGYVTEINYTLGYYPELNPLRYQWALNYANTKAAAPQNVCELGFGQGLSFAIHATTQANVNYWGTDFNPAHAAHAQSLLDAAGVSAHVFDLSFAEFCQKSDLPEFDFISLHGIWSWISDENRHIIVDFIRRKLKVGGVVYISYNTQPGWAAMVPVRKVLTQYAEKMGGSGQSILGRVSSAMTFFEQFLELKPNYIKQNPAVEERFKKLKSQNPSYLAHEYFNRDWHPMPFADMAEYLEAAKLNYVCSASIMDHLDGFNFSPEQIKFLKDIADLTFRETMRDMLNNQQFRRDYWVKGPLNLNLLQRQELMLNSTVILSTARKDMTLKVQCGLGEGDLNAKQYQPLLDILSDYKPMRLSEIMQSIQAAGHPISTIQLIEMCCILMSKGNLQLVQQTDQTVIDATRKLNRHLLTLAKSNSDISVLACAVIGGAIPVPYLDQLAMLMLSEGKTTTAEIESGIWNLLKQQNRRLIVQGKTLDTEEENRKEIQNSIESFMHHKKTMYTSLGLLES